MEQKSIKDRLREITESIEQGIKDLFESEKYRQYLRTMSRFHRYSVNNTLLIAMQRPDATRVAGYNKWRDQFGRHVRKGEKGIQIIAPTPYKKKIEEVKLDPDTKAPLLDKDGNAIMEEKEIKIPMFRVVSVFDVSQTEGRPLPQLANTLTGKVEQYDVFMEALRRSSPLPIEEASMQDSTDGFLSLKDQKICIRKGMSEVQTVCAAIHEIAHAKLHNTALPVPENAPLYQEIEIFDIPALFSNGRIAAENVPEGLFRYDLRGSDYDPGYPVTVEERVVVNHAGTILTAKPLKLPESGRLALTDEEGLNFTGGEITAYQFREEQKKDRYTEEVEAESISYTVCQYYGIETADNSFGYIAGWSQGKDLQELRASLETINHTASELITDIDHNFREICKERGITLEAAEQPKEAMYQLDDSMLLHLQPTDNGYDYTIYDSADKHILDGGRLSDSALDIAAAQRAVFVLHELEPDVIEELSPAEMQRVLESTDGKILGAYAIYQLKDSEENRPYQFSSLSELMCSGLSVERERYEMKYSDVFAGKGDTYDHLNALYHKFNVDQPKDFTGHSLSVSDIIVLRRPEGVTYHYVDSWGFRELSPNFTPLENPLKNAEMSLEDDYGMIDGIINNGKKPTIAELEAQASAGQPISLMDLADAVHREQMDKRPSVMQQLKTANRQEHKKTASKDAEMER